MPERKECPETEEMVQTMQRVRNRKILQQQMTPEPAGNTGEIQKILAKSTCYAIY